MLYHQFLKFIESEGISAGKAIKMHIDSLDYIERVLKRGANLRIGRIVTQSLQWDEHWPHIVSNLVQVGYIHQAMPRHNAVPFMYTSEELPVVNIYRDYTYIGRVFLPKL